MFTAHHASPVRPSRFFRARVGLLGLIALIAGLLVTLAGPPPAAVDAAQDQVRVRYEWQLDVQNSGVEDDLYDVAFINEQVGLAVGNNATILRTTNGGASWQRVTERRDRGTRFVDVVFTSPSEAWVRGGKDLLQTTNGGDTWRTVGLPQRCQDGTRAMSISGPSIYLNCLIWVYRSDDAGRNWTELPGRLDLNDFESMAFTGPNQGLLVRSQGDGARFGAVAATNDGGQTWQVSSLLGGGQIAFDKVQFVSPTTGWIMPSRRETILGTRDGGQTWDGFFTGTRVQVDFHFLNDAMGFLLVHSDRPGRSTTGEVFGSLDGGQSWTSIGVLTNPAAMQAVHAPVPEHVWAVGQRGYIAHLRYVAIPLEPEAAPEAPAAEE